MLCMEFRFLAGRYHATPWDHHANEGAVEWPPSPWRLLRALVATWKRRRPETDDATMSRIVAALSEPPLYRLPDHGSGHSRHYVPLGGKSGKTGLMLDSFLTVSTDDPLLVVWPHQDLAPQDRKVLGDLLSQISYLGRAESWVEARLVPRDELANEDWLSRIDAEPAKLTEPDRTEPADSDPPHPAISSQDQDVETVRLLAPMTASEYESWHPGALEALKTVATTSKSRKSRKPAPLPTDVLGCLQMGTRELRSPNQGWSSPPGATWISYRVRSRLLPPAPMSRTRSRHEASRPTVAVFALTSDTHLGDVRPLVTGGLGLAETFRQGLMSWSSGNNDLPSPVFSGKDANGAPLSGHQHAYVLPTDDDGDGYIDHVVIVARMGFGERERSALYSLRKLWQSKGKADLFPLLIGLGHPTDFAPNPQRNYYQPGRTKILARARIWRSITPYILTRHPKKKGKDSPEQQLVRDLERLGLPVPERLERTTNVQVGRRTYRWIEFTTNRRGGRGARAARIGHGFEISFPEPVEGPIAVGYGAHFGLGLFAAQPDS